MARPRTFKVGDRIKFKAATRSDCKVAVRKVVGLSSLGWPEVRYHGWDNFLVRPSEVIARVSRED
jgi:hypothetical protein